VKALEPGRIRTVDLGRRFQITTGTGRSLKATLLRRESHLTQDFWALRHVDLEVEPGETFGIVGRNGSGKSTLLKLLARIYGPSEGACQVGGRMSSLLELGAGFHPEFSAVENIFLAGAIYGIPKSELARDVDEIIAFAELEPFAHQPIKTFSSGMFARLGFSVAMHVKPDILLLDEVLAVGDEAFVQKCHGRLTRHRENGGTVVFISHDPHAVESLCSRAMILDQGRSVFIGTASDAIIEYHRKLVAEEHRITVPEDAVDAHSDVTVRVSVINSAGEHCDRLMEGEPISFSVELTPHVDVREARVRIGIRTSDGHGLGNQALTGVRLEKDVPQTLTLRIEAPPFRYGLFAVGVIVQAADESRNYARLEDLAQFSIFSKRQDAQGPVFLNGSWGS
jgi:lipopolysaccharide transport system ATP-binding protein